MEYIEVIKELHSKGMTDMEISKIIDKSYTSVHYQRKKLHLESNDKIRNNIKYKNVKNELLKGTSIYRIKQLYNCYDYFVKKVAKENNIKTISFKEMINSRRIVKSNPFNDLNNPQVQYWLGFLATDGAIGDNRISLGLQEQDELHIDKFIKFLEYPVIKSKSIKDNKFISYRASFRNKNVCDFLISLGITPNKSFSLEYKGEFTNDFLRGVIDGDGYIRKNHCEIGIATASYIFAKQLQNFIINNYKVNCTIRKYSYRNTYNVGITGYKQVTFLLNCLYKNADIYLERKYLNAISNGNI